VSGDWGCREERRRGAASAVQRGGGGDTFYRAGRRWRGGEEVGGGGVLIPVGFEELKGEEETGRRRFSGGSEGGMIALRFGSSHAEEGGSRQHTARWRGRIGGGADGSWRWEPMERRKWAE
jgi:hypothetical protein